ncbi:MAG: OB-fold nucleic acid binding domain-containing protein [Candidatus Nanopelagicales bacterium]|nr:OB-fold nucleic acid binding domain-containing protein [Candidatus Nanopelagicales bacterium]MCF8550633.1 OB-fold nucleic acid binding domain-containing protein [Candidatus Nanopelagicales bacterium]
MSVNPVGALIDRIKGWASSSDAGDLRDYLQEHAISERDQHLEEISTCQPGAQVEIMGTVKIVAIRPRDVAPAVEIELSDPSGTVHVVWLGRRKIPGIVAGRTLKVCGRLTCNTERPTIFNPRYELLPLSR